MKLGYYGARLAAATRLFKVSGVGKTSTRGMRSTPDGNSANRRSELTDYEQGRPELWHASHAAYEEEFPPLSACVRPKAKGKRMARSDLGDSSKQKPKEIKNVEALQFETSTLINHQEDTSLRRKRHSSCNKSEIPQTHDGHGEAKQRSMPCTNAIKNEPFDICLSEGNGGTWIQKVKVDTQSIVDYDKPECNAQRNDAVEETGCVLRPGMVLFKRYLSLDEQVYIVNKCQELGCGPGGFYRPGYNDGAKLRLYMMCLGLDWNPQTKSYGEIRHHDNVAPPPIPHEFTSIVSRALDDSHTLIKRDLKVENVEEVLPAIYPDVCIVNFYTTAGRLGLHQDRDESVESLQKGLPVVSISIGDSADFLYGDSRDVDKATCVKLESGDVLMFGGESRHVFHGVRAIIPHTASPELREITNLRPGRLNLTFRQCETLPKPKTNC